MKIKKIILLALLGYSLYLGARYYQDFQQLRERRIAYQKRRAAWDRLEQRLLGEIGQFSGEVGVVIKDLETDWQFSHQPQALFASASIVKVPIMAACFIAADENKLDLKRQVTLRARDKLSGSGELKKAAAGSVFSVEELIGFMIYNSDNTAANMLTNVVGMNYFNSSFKAMGLKNTNMARRVADYYARNKGVENFTTTEDMSVILDKIYHGQLINKDISDKCLKLLTLSKINDRINKYLPAELTIAHKTGLERTVCHDMGIVFTPQGDFLICVLTKHANSKSAPSKELIAKLALHTYKYLNQLQ